MALRFTLEKLAGNFGVEVRDIVVPEISDEELRHILLYLYEHRVVVLKTGGLTKDQLVTFARRVGEPIALSRKGEHPEIIPITNINIDSGKEMAGAAHWHTDQSFKEEVSSVTMLYSVQAPTKGGETLFCNMAAAYDALPSTLQQRVEELIVEHRHGKSVAARPEDHTPLPPKGWDQSTTVYHPLVRQHPITGQRTLYAVTGTSQGIKGMKQADAEVLLRELCDHVLQDRFIMRHEHCVGDVVMWDNPTTMHCATPIAAARGPDDTRLIHRISLRGRPSVFR